MTLTKDSEVLNPIHIQPSSLSIPNIDMQQFASMATGLTAHNSDQQRQYNVQLFSSPSSAPAAGSGGLSSTLQGGTSVDYTTQSHTHASDVYGVGNQSPNFMINGDQQSTLQFHHGLLEPGLGSQTFSGDWTEMNTDLYTQADLGVNSGSLEVSCAGLQAPIKNTGGLLNTDKSVNGNTVSFDSLILFYFDSPPL